MIQNYINAVMQSLNSVLYLFVRLALPISLLLGLLVVAASVVFWNRRAGNSDAAFPPNGKQLAANTGGFLLAGLVLIACWSALHASLPIAKQTVDWREKAEATENPAPDAPTVEQYGPTAAVMEEKTYSRNLTLPPYLLERIGTDGIGVLAPYLSDPSAENVTRLTDTFRKSGRDMILTRQVTRIDETATPLSSAQVRATFKALAGRAYDAQFEGRYTFQNPKTAPAEMRFVFPLPYSGTLRNVSVTVGGQAVADPNEGRAYEWKGTVGAGETRDVIVRYQVTGARTWSYGMGSQRRRVQKFGLEAVTNNNVRFLRGSLTPTKRSGGTLRWELDDVVTSQQIALSFAPSAANEELYLQALSALPAGLAVFLLGACVLLWTLPKTGRLSGPLALALGLALFTLGLGAAPVLANYVGFILALLLAPLAGSACVAALLGKRFLLAAVPAALIPAAFLSGQHSGALLLLLAVITVGAFWFFLRGIARVK